MHRLQSILIAALLAGCDVPTPDGTSDVTPAPTVEPPVSVLPPPSGEGQHDLAIGQGIHPTMISRPFADCTERGGKPCTLHYVAAYAAGDKGLRVVVASDAFRCDAPPPDALEVIQSGNEYTPYTIPATASASWPGHAVVDFGTTELLEDGRGVGGRIRLNIGPDEYQVLIHGALVCSLTGKL